MDLLARLVAGAILTSACAFAASAQIPPGLPNPGLQNRIPAPLPPPPQPPVINGPLSQGSSQSGPGVYLPPRLNTFSDRASACAVGYPPCAAEGSTATCAAAPTPIERTCPLPFPGCDADGRSPGAAVGALRRSGRCIGPSKPRDGFQIGQFVEYGSDHDTTSRGRHHHHHRARRRFAGGQGAFEKIRSRAAVDRLSPRGKADQSAQWGSRDVCM